MDLMMLHSFSRRVRLLLLISMMGLGGCASLMEVVPAPPGFLVTVQLDGPYDADIPPMQANQIKNAGRMSDWAVPYIFLRVATDFESVGDEERSLHFFDRAIHEFRRRNNLSGEGTALSRKISALIHFGRFQTAYLVTEELAKKWTSPPFSAFVFYNYAYCHQKKGDYVKAREYFRQALAAGEDQSDDPDLMALRRDTELGYGMNLILADYLSAVSGRLCRLDFDDDFYQQIRRNMPDAMFHWDQVSALNAKIQKTKVRRFFPEIIPSLMACDVLNYRGLSFGIDGKAPEAFKNLETSARIARKAGYRLGEADNIFFLSHVYLLDKNRRSEGLQAVKALAEMAGRYQLVSYSIWAEMILAHYDKAAGETARAVKAMDKALELMEKNVSWFSREADARGIGFFNGQVIYETLLEMHVSGGRKQEAFQTAERAKAALLINRISKEVGSQNYAPSEDVKRIHFYRRQLTENCLRILSPVSLPAVFMDRVEKIKQARTEYMRLLEGIKEKDAFLYSACRVVPLETNDLQRLLDGNTTLFAYFTGEQALYIWVISRNGFHQEKIQMSRKDVDRLTDAYLSAILSKDKVKADAVAEKVYDTFLRPVIPFVYGDRLGFVPHGSLYSLPFASMRYVQSYLVDGFTIFYLPHAGLLKHLLVKNSTTDLKNVMILSDARCVEKKQSAPRAAAEMNVLKKIFPQADYAVQTAASKEDQPLTGHYEIIHRILCDCFAKEALSDSCSLVDSAGHNRECPQIQDIFRLRLSGRTAVLSPCPAEENYPARKSGVSGMTSAWLYAVSPQVVTQLWEVEDKARAVFMGMFYENLKKSTSAADSLRTAQNGMIQSGYGPSDWAAFVLTGRY